MQGLEGDTIGGFNAMIEQQKKEPGEAFVSTVLFDDQTEVLHDRVKLGEVRPITEKEYYRTRLRRAHEGRVCFADWYSQEVQVYEKSYQSARESTTAVAAREGQKETQIKMKRTYLAPELLQIMQTVQKRALVGNIEF